MNISAKLLKSALTILTTDLPVWAFLIFSAAIYVLTRPGPQPDPGTRIVYKDRWELPAPKLKANPSIITIYNPYPVKQLDTVTVYVPINFGPVNLFNPDRVSNTRSGITIQAFDPDQLRFKEYTYQYRRPAFGLSAVAGADYHMMDGSIYFKTGLQARYKDFYISALTSTQTPLILEVAYRLNF